MSFNRNMKLVFDNLVDCKIVVLVLVLIISVANAQSEIFTISSSNGCDIDGQPVFWDGENVDIACTMYITFALEIYITKESGFLFTFGLPNLVQIAGDFKGRVMNNVTSATDVSLSFTVTSFSSATDSAAYVCTSRNTTGMYTQTVNLTGRIFTKPPGSSIPITTKVGGVTVTNGGTITISSDAAITLETSSVSGSPVPTLSITRDGNNVSCSQTTSLASTTRKCQATVSVSDLQSTPKITASASLCDVSNSMTFTITFTSGESGATSRATSNLWFLILLWVLIKIFRDCL